MTIDLTPKVSVIIPVYNVEKYLGQCLDSIINQTLVDIEIICINDASPDNCKEILDEYAQKDERIKILNHDQNYGLSESRNSGLKIANGEYIYFMDSDDLLDLDTLEICYNISLKNKLDVLTFDAEVFLDPFNSEEISKEKEIYDYQRNLPLDSSAVYTGDFFLIYSITKGAYKPSACLSFIKRNLFINNNIRFYPGIIHEDELFTVQLYLLSNRLMYYPRQFFKRRLRDRSIMSKKRGLKNAQDILLISKELYKIYNQERLLGKPTAEVVLKRIYTLMHWIENMIYKDAIIEEKKNIEFLLKKNEVWGKYRKHKAKVKIYKLIKKPFCIFKTFLKRIK